MKISIFGTGYVGLVTGTCFAEMGHEVIAVDRDDQKIQCLQQGRCPIYEPGLQELILSNQKAQRLSFTTDAMRAVHQSSILFIAVGTPPGESGQADLSAVLQVAKSIGQTMTQPKWIVNKSTVPVGTAPQVKRVIQQELQMRGLDFEVEVISNPEFLKEGTALEDCFKPSRIIVGTDSLRARAVMQRLYEPFCKNGHPIYFMDTASSEMTKYAANAMLASRISLMNEIARLCEKLGADIEQVRQGIGSDPRIGQQFLYAGVGYGGSCFPKDVQALVKIGQGVGEELPLIRAVEATNWKQRILFFDQVKHHFGGSLVGKKIALWGLSFKPGTDDIRESPALFVMQKLLEHSAQVTAYDPVAMPAVRAFLELSADTFSVELMDNPYEGLKSADALCILTEWKPFREPHLEKMKQMMKSFVIFDGRNLFQPQRMKEEGFCYYSIGRQVVGN